MIRKVIYKYPLKVTDSQIVNLPVGAVVLDIQNQNETPCLWALVDPKEEISYSRFFSIFGTGHNIDVYDDCSLNYISTFQLMNGSLVFHAFELLNIETK